MKSLINTDVMDVAVSNNFISRPIPQFLHFIPILQIGYILKAYVF